MLEGSDPALRLSASCSCWGRIQLCFLWGGESSGAAVVFNQDLMYLAGGKGFLVFNVRDAKNPTKVGEAINTGALMTDGGAALA